MLLDLLQNDGFSPKKKTSNEYGGPCPFCGGNDRFIVFAEENKYWCRQCGAKGDAIQYLREFRKMNFPEAAELVGKPIAENHQKATSRPGTSSCLAPTRPPKKEQPVEWSERAKKLVAYGKKQLAEHPEVQEWLRLERGITLETAERFSLGWNPKDQWREKAEWGVEEDGKKMFFPSGLIIPLEKAVKIRRDNPGEYKGKPNKRYYLVKDSTAEPLIIGEPYETTAIIVESELDAILLSQEIKRKTFIVALGSCSNRPDEALIQNLEHCPVVLVALDTDDAGGKHAKWWLENVSNTHRTLTPQSYGKDLTESFLNGLDLNEWLSFSLQMICPASGFDNQF